MHAIWWLRYGVCTRALKGCALNLNPKPYAECVLGHTFFRVRKGQHSARGFRFSAHPFARDCHLVYIHCGHLFKKKKENTALSCDLLHIDGGHFDFTPWNDLVELAKASFWKVLFSIFTLSNVLFSMPPPGTTSLSLWEYAISQRSFFFISLDQKSSFRLHPLQRPRWAGEIKPFLKQKRVLYILA